MLKEEVKKSVSGVYIAYIAISTISGTAVSAISAIYSGVSTYSAAATSTANATLNKKRLEYELTLLKQDTAAKIKGRRRNVK